MQACHRLLRLQSTHSSLPFKSTANAVACCHRRSLRSRLCCTAETSSQSVPELASDPEHKHSQTDTTSQEHSARSGDKRSTGGDRRKSSSGSRPAAAASPTAVALSGAAAAAGKLPEVLSATFPETFPTLSAARRGKQGTSGLRCAEVHVGLVGLLLCHPASLTVPGTAESQQFSKHL